APPPGLARARSPGRPDRGRARRTAGRLPPLEVLLRNARMEQPLEPVQRLPVGEDDLGDRAPVDLAGLVEDPLAEALEQCGANLVILAEQPVDDLVARDGRRAVACEGGEGFALPRPD